MELEKALQRLEEIKTLLENPEISLDEAIKLYEESVKYTKESIEQLRETEGKIVAIKTELDSVVEQSLNLKED